MNLFLASLSSPNAFLGIFFIILFFLSCLFLVAGIKLFYVCFLQKYFSKFLKAKKTKPILKKEKPKPKARTIEINTEGIDKIYFKKSS